jgi:hypothetical protein
MCDLSVSAITHGPSLYKVDRLNWYANQNMATRVLVLMAALIVIAFVIQRVIS